MFDRMFDGTFNPITTNRIDSLGLIGCSIEHLILSRLIKQIYYDQSDISLLKPSPILKFLTIFSVFFFFLIFFNFKNLFIYYFQSLFAHIMIH